MVGNGSFAVSRSHSGDRFYNPPAMRRHQQQQLLLQQQQLLNKQQQRSNVERPSKSEAAVVVVEAENRTTDSDDSASTLSKTTSVCSSSPPSTAAGDTNLDRLVEAVTPCVTVQFSPEVSGRGLRRREAEPRLFYRLEDLWKSLSEWSAYGAGVPLLLNGKESIVQYFVPYLSGIQLYVDPSKPPSKNRLGEKSNADSSSRDPSSGGSSDYEADRRTKCATDRAYIQQNTGNSLNSRSGREKSPTSSPGEGEIDNLSGLLVFEYLEREQPYFRKPFTDKIVTLASQFPELGLYRSCDLLPSSWISIAWYPIYRIPIGSTLKDLDASFLTIHSLSTHSRNSVQPQFHGASGGQKVNCVSSATPKIALPIIGLASYKYNSSLLTTCGPQEREKESLLLQAANDWLQGVQGCVGNILMALISKACHKGGYLRCDPQTDVPLTVLVVWDDFESVDSQP